MKNSNGTIRNQTRDLPVCSAVPQPCHCVPRYTAVAQVNEMDTTFTQILINVTTLRLQNEIQGLQLYIP
jgi:hypothetical protein